MARLIEVKIKADTSDFVRRMNELMGDPNVNTGGVMETKPGWMTTEFWVTVFAALFPVLNLTDIWNWASNWHAGILLTVLGAAYSVARGQAKQGIPFDPNAKNMR